MDLSQAPSRLRRTFKYPSDDTSPSDPSSRDELDETEQEALIETLTVSATRHDHVFRLIFTVLPLIAILPFLWHLLVAPTLASTPSSGDKLPGSSRSHAGVLLMTTLLSITSLCISAYQMYTVRLDHGLGRPGKRPSVIFRSSSNALSAADLDVRGPLVRYLPYMNVAIAVVLGCASYALSGGGIGRGRGGVGDGGFWVLLLVPGVMLGVVLVVKRSMVEIETGLGELKGMRYEYKGA